MNILFLSDNFPPETNAPASRTFDHTKYWAELGNQVTVVTCAPNFPEGEVHQGYQNKWFSSEVVEGVRVIRVKTFIYSNEGFFLRIMDFLSFMVTSFFAGLFLSKPDVVVATSPQFFTACAGAALGFVKRTPFVFELRDLWPDSIVAVGAIKEGLICNMLRKLELFLYQRSSLIVSVTEAFKTNLVLRGVPEQKICVVANGIDPRAFRGPLSKNHELKRSLGLEKQFVVGYIGNHGLAQGLAVVLEAARKISDSLPVVFLLVGSGAQREDLIEKAKTERIKNVIFVPRQNKTQIINYWSICDLSLIHLINEPIFQTVIPSKLYEAMGLGLPIILGAPRGEATSLVKKYNCGVVIDADNADRLADAVMDLYNDLGLRNKLAINGLENSSRYFRDHLAEKMLSAIKILEKVVR